MKEKLFAYKLPESNGWWNVGAAEQMERNDPTGTATLYKSDAEEWANFLAAAPDMYEALDCLYYLHSSGAFKLKDEDYSAIAKAAAALKKAEGGTP